MMRDTNDKCVYWQRASFYQIEHPNPPSWDPLTWIVSCCYTGADSSLPKLTWKPCWSPVLPWLFDWAFHQRDSQETVPVCWIHIFRPCNFSAICLPARALLSFHLLLKLYRPIQCDSKVTGWYWSRSWLYLARSHLSSAWSLADLLVCQVVGHYLNYIKLRFNPGSP